MQGDHYSLTNYSGSLVKIIKNLITKATDTSTRKIKRKQNRNLNC